MSMLYNVDTVEHGDPTPSPARLVLMTRVLDTMPTCGMSCMSYGNGTVAVTFDGLTSELKRRRNVTYDGS